MWMITAVLFAAGWGVKDEAGKSSWIAVLLFLLALIFGVFATFATLNWTAFTASTRVREWQTARTYAVRAVAESVSKLTMGRQFEIVEQFGLVVYDIIPGEPEPVFFLRVPSGHVPYQTVVDFLSQSVATAPLLLDVRRGGLPWREATLITALIVSQGWATKAAGPHAATLTVPLETVARRLGVDPSDLNTQEVIDE